MDSSLNLGRALPSYPGDLSPAYTVFLGAIAWGLLTLVLKEIKEKFTRNDQPFHVMTTYCNREPIWAAEDAHFTSA